MMGQKREFEREKRKWLKKRRERGLRPQRLSV